MEILFFIVCLILTIVLLLACLVGAMLLIGFVCDRVLWKRLVSGKILYYDSPWGEYRHICGLCKKTLTCSSKHGVKFVCPHGHYEFSTECGQYDFRVLGRKFSFRDKLPGRKAACLAEIARACEAARQSNAHYVVEAGPNVGHDVRVLKNGVQVQVWHGPGWDGARDYVLTNGADGDSVDDGLDLLWCGNVGKIRSRECERARAAAAAAQVERIHQTCERRIL